MEMPVKAVLCPIMHRQADPQRRVLFGREVRMELPGLILPMVLLQGLPIRVQPPIQ